MTTSCKSKNHVQRTNLKDEYFGLAGETAAILNRANEVINVNEAVSAIELSIVTVTQDSHREAVTVCVILTSS